MPAWNFMPQFRGLDLTESCVLGWTVGEDLVFSVEFLLTPEHPRFKAPPRDEWGCYVRGRLRFPHVTSLTGLLAPADIPPCFDATGERDFGTIDDLAQVADGYEISGDFGDVVLASDDPFVELDDAG